MNATFVNITGTVKFFDQQKGFGFIATDQGDIFINQRIAGDQAEKLIKGAMVKIDFVSRYEKGQYRRDTSSLLSVSAPPAPSAPVTVLSTVAWYDEQKGFGFIECVGYDLPREQAFLHSSVCKAAGIMPGNGMPIRALVVLADKGPKVISFEWGEAVEAELRAKLESQSTDAPMIAEAKDGPPPEPEAPAKKPTAKKAASKTAAKKPAAKTSKKAAPKKASVKKTEPPADVAAMVTTCASTLNGSGGTMAAAMTQAAQAH